MRYLILLVLLTLVSACSSVSELERETSEVKDNDAIHCVTTLEGEYKYLDCY